MATACTPKGIYTALIAAGFSTTQAIGAMANGMAESSLNPEANVVDSNGYRSYGIWQFNAQSYPNASGLVTGNCSADINAQVGLLKASVSGQALAGSTPGQVASNFAQYFERCQTCQPGGASNVQRVANAGVVAGWVSSGSWPTSASGLSGSSSSSSAAAGGEGSAATGSACLIQFPGVTIPVAGSIGSFCIFSKGEARALIGGMLLFAGGGLFVVGALILAAGAFQRSGATAAVARIRQAPFIP
jgi:tail lysozyme